MDTNIMSPCSHMLTAPFAVSRLQTTQAHGDLATQAHGDLATLFLNNNHLTSTPGEFMLAFN